MIEIQVNNLVKSFEVFLDCISWMLFLSILTSARHWMLIINVDFQIDDIKVSEA